MGAMAVHLKIGTHGGVGCQGTAKVSMLTLGHEADMKKPAKRRASMRLKAPHRTGRPILAIVQRLDIATDELRALFAAHGLEAPFEV